MHTLINCVSMKSKILLLFCLGVPVLTVSEWTGVSDLPAFSHMSHTEAVSQMEAVG